MKGATRPVRRRVVVWLALGYAVLLATSHLVRWQGWGPTAQDRYADARPGNGSESGGQRRWIYETLLEAVPHFGRLDGFRFDRGYARSFFDSDQRPLPGSAARVEVPVLIVHGRHDPLVPFAAAVENHRIIPHSELVTLDSDHFDLFRAPGQVAVEIGRFVDRVEAGTAPVLEGATPKRIAAATEPFDPSTLPPASGLNRWIWVALMALATLVSEDLTTISAGLWVAQGRIDFLTAVGACSLGILAGDVLLFWAGRWLGRPWLGRRPLRWFLSERRIDEASAWFGRRGAVVILLSRFTPGMRLPTYFAAGALRTDFRRFLLYFALSVALWTPLVVWVSGRFGSVVFESLGGSDLAPGWGLALLAVALWSGLALVRGFATAAGRRRLRARHARFRRRLRWEFWPPYVFYLPVVVWILWLGVRFRSLTLFTAANPAMPAGGFVGESKTAILDRLPVDRVARYRRLEVPDGEDSRREQIEEFLDIHRLRLPVVLKPDVGQRGTGVVIAKGWTEIDDYLSAHAGPLIVQEFVAGPELGVFYVRLPDARHGRIFSITEKILPAVVGDGVSTLETLALRDPEVSVRAHQLLGAGEHRSDSVPAAGEVVTLAELGTHCRGAIFHDGERFRSAALELAIDRMSRCYEGFCFGRYDVRAGSTEALVAGRELRVLELNGVTSEATHIYDPRHSLVDAYRVLFTQWRIAFEIGAAQRERGVEPSSVGALVGLVWQAVDRRPRRGSAAAQRQGVR